MFKLEWEGGGFFFKPTRKGEKWTILCFGGEKLSSGSKYRQEQPRGTGLLKQLCVSLTLSIESYKHLKLCKIDEIGQIDNRNQVRVMSRLKEVERS